MNHYLANPASSSRTSYLTLSFLSALFAILATITVLNRVLPTFAFDGFDATGCPTFPATASNETDLNNAITCYNTINVPGEYILTLSADINLTTATTQINNPTAGVELTLDGAGRTIDGQGIPGVRPFHIASSTKVTMQAITITGGTVTGPGNNLGGGIYNLGNLTLINSHLTNNTALSGGAVNVSGAGALNIYSSVFYANTSVQDGGAVHITGNVLYIRDSLFRENHAGSSAGAIWAEAVNNWIGYTTFLSNTAQENGGALSNLATLSMANSTFSGNMAAKQGGAAEVLALATLIDSTISDNTAGFGGGIALVDNGVLNLNHVTMNENTAITATGGLSLTNGSFAYVLNSIIANSSDIDCAGPGNFNDLRYNLFEDGTCITDPTSISGDPNLGPLADNGGVAGLIFPTLTHALLPDSPAVDHILNGQNNCGSAGNEDQRGVTRPQGNGCDIGAFEGAILPLNISVTGDGTVTGSGINCSVVCTVDIYENTAITLTATPDPGFTFIGWSGDCSGTADCILTINAPKTVSATFAPAGLKIFLPAVLK